ncbi:DNA polymerase-3 subunit beta [Pullulanibacillus pueri]|uniref:Beta sliding clamp n=1 Tax=Pullulanibacillus pueri TaxID=1437324 RepID=A0A8J3ELP1_9BACL|nr:DNA polymerase III subunit beta [Pullulanibacillus pueri]MBM7681643.1 DNA polymerase-3 subunit beta [Pullulanibacillus pueri]GGH79334.1 DNA polymerase III subunit beta [Pullulanibacillus pueri]
MEFIINNQCLNQAIYEVSQAVASKAILPILLGVKIIAEKDRLTLIGSNTNIAIESMIPLMVGGQEVLKVMEPGSLVLPAKYLSDLVKKLPGEVHLKSDAHRVTLQSDTIKTALNVLNVEEYPNLPEIEHKKIIHIKSRDLSTLIKQTVFAASKRESNPILTGVNFSFQDNTLTCVATNSHRLSLRTLTIPSEIKGSFTIPSASLLEVHKLMHDEVDEILIGLTDHTIVFQAKGLSVYSRLLEGTYPNVSSLLLREFKTVLILNTENLLKGIDRATLFASEWKNHNVNLEIIEDSQLLISSHSSEIGTIEEVQDIDQMIGERSLCISLDGAYVKEALKVIEEKAVKVSFGGSMSPVLIEPVDNPAHKQLISPVRS